MRCWAVASTSSMRPLQSGGVCWMLLLFQLHCNPSWGEIKAVKTMHLFNSNGYKCKQLILFIQSFCNITSIGWHYVALWTFCIVIGANVKVWEGFLPGRFKSFIRAFIRECFLSITLLVYAKQGAGCWDVWKWKGVRAGTLARHAGRRSLANWKDYLILKVEYLNISDESFRNNDSMVCVWQTDPGMGRAQIPTDSKRSV